MAKKKEKKPSKPMQVWTLYDKGERKNKTCPKCGPGVFLANHKDRSVCGKCGFTEFSKGDSGAKTGAPKEDKKPNEEAKSEKPKDASKEDKKGSSEEKKE